MTDQRDDTKAYRMNSMFLFISGFFAAIGSSGFDREQELIGIGGLFVSAGFYLARPRYKKSMRVTGIILSAIGIGLIVAHIVTVLLER